MTDEAWQRHANPWSVYTRFAAIPAMILAIWSRVWIGWWALVPVAAVIIWLWLNPHVFPAVTTPRSWAARGIYGERLWLLEPSNVPAGYRAVLRWLIASGLCGIVLLVWGLVQLFVWPTVFGATQRKRCRHEVSASKVLRHGKIPSFLPGVRLALRRAVPA